FVSDLETSGTPVCEYAQSPGSEPRRAFERSSHSCAAPLGMRDLRCPRIRQVEYGGQGSWGRLLVNCIGAQSATLADETKHDGSPLEDGDNVRLSVGDHAIPRLPPLDCSG